MEKLDEYCHNKILNMLQLVSQINYLSTCRIFYYKLSIEKLIVYNLNQNFTTNYIFRNVTTLDIYYNKNVTNYNKKLTNISSMKNLKILKADALSEIDQDG
jgi:hypothetical protein